MPCDSRVVNTQMVDVEQLAKAIEALGGTVDQKSPTMIRGKIAGEYFAFGRDRADAKTGFRTTMANIGRLEMIQRKYSEIGIRTFAQRKGYTVAQNGDEFTLINRRGK